MQCADGAQLHAAEKHHSPEGHALESVVGRLGDSGGQEHGQQRYLRAGCRLSEVLCGPGDGAVAGFRSLAANADGVQAARTTAAGPAGSSCLISINKHKHA